MTLLKISLVFIWGITIVINNFTQRNCMRYFRAENLTKTYVSTPIVDHVTFSIEKWKKIALVAKNWGWKTTLIKLMMWELDMTEGDIERRKWIKKGYLSQNFNLNSEKTVAEEVFETDHRAAWLIKQYEELMYSTDSDKLTELIPLLDENDIWSYQAKVDTILSRLQLQELLHQQIKTLSWWEKKRVALAKTLIDEPEMLILDEPTNHLDVQMIEWLENYLKTENVTLFMVTHDRYFLESVCDEIYEIERWKLYKYPANYELFLEKQSERHYNEQVEQEKLRQLLKRELEWIRKSPRARATKQHFREKEFYKIEEKYDSNKALYESEKPELEIPLQKRRLGTKILQVRHLKKSFWNKIIVKDFSHDFKYCERIWLVGNNWVGKSTFISMLTWNIQQDSWTIEVGKTVVFWEYQQSEITYQAEKRVVDVVKDIAWYITLANWERLSAEKLLEMFLFPVHQRYQPAARLSGGEKRRLALVCVLMKNPNFLILDEPTNDLDLITISILEDFLSQYQWCLIIVSHDRSFMDRLVDHIFVFEWEWKITDYWWTYTEWRNEQDEKKQKNEQHSLKKNNVEEQEDAPISKISYEQQVELDQLIKDLEALEKEKAEITQLFDNKDLAYDDITLLSEHLGEITKEIQRKEARWFELLEQ